MLAIAIDRRSAPRRAQKHLMECETVLRLETLRVGRKIGGKLRLAGFRDRGIFGKKFHFLPHAAADNDIVAVEAGCPALAVEHFIANVVVDKTLQFLLARRAPPRASKTVREIVYPAEETTILSGASVFVLPTK